MRARPNVTNSAAGGVDGGDWVTPLLRGDPVARVSRRFFAHPAKLALRATFIVVCIQLGGGLILSTIAARSGVTPVWKDWALPAAASIWVSLIWGYAWQPSVVSRLMDDVSGLLSDGEAQARLRRDFALAGHWVWSWILLLALSGIGVWWTFGHEPSDYHRMYFREHLAYYWFFASFLVLMFYMAILSALRQAWCGGLITKALDGYQAEERPDHLGDVLLLKGTVGTLSTLVLPYVVAGLGLGMWAVWTIRDGGLEGNPFIAASLFLYLPLLAVSVLLPLGQMIRVMSRIRRREVQQIKDNEWSAYRSIDPEACDLSQLKQSNDRFDELQRRYKAIAHLVPLLPIAGGQSGWLPLLRRSRLDLASWD